MNLFSDCLIFIFVITPLIFKHYTANYVLDNDQ